MSNKVTRISEYREKKKGIPFEWTHPVPGKRLGTDVFREKTRYKDIYTDPRGFFKNKELSRDESSSEEGNPLK